MIMIFGAGGAGKSTQGRLLAEQMGRTWLSAGQLIRDAKEFSAYTATGAMIPEDILVDLLWKNMQQEFNGGKEVVFDGQPGSPEQILLWEKVGMIPKIEFVVVLKVPEDKLIERLKGRGREDDNISVWRRKIEYFEQKSYSFFGELKKKGVRVIEVDGDGSIEQVNRRILQILQEK